MILIKKFLIDIAKKSELFRKILRKGLLLKNQTLNLFNNFSKVDNKKIIFESYMGRSYSCSPKAIYEAMLKDPKFKDYKFVWVFRDVKEKDTKQTKYVTYKSKEYYKEMGSAKYIITNSRLRDEIKKKKNQIYLQCWHGTPLKRLGHDIVEGTISSMNSKNEIKKRYTKESKKFDYFISPSKFATEKFKSAFLIENSDIMIEEGYPRNDYLFNYKKEELNEIKKELNIPDEKKIILYAPTFRDNQHDSKLGYTYNLEVDFDYLKENLKDYVILFRAHYLVAEKFDFKKYEGFIYNVSDIDDVNYLYVISDILLTDYSSVFFDFANLNRKMVFYMYDLEEYKEKLRGFYLNINELPGDIVFTKEALLESIKDDNYFEKYNNKYKNFNKKYNYLEDGKAAERVIERVFK